MTKNRITLNSIAAAHEIASHIAIGPANEFIEIALNNEPRSPVARLRGGQVYNELRFVGVEPPYHETTNATVTIEAHSIDDSGENGVSHSSSSSRSRTPEDAKLTGRLLLLATEVVEILNGWAKEDPDLGDEPKPNTKRSAS